MNTRNNLINAVRVFDRLTGYVDLVVRIFLIVFMISIFVFIFCQVIIRFTPLRVFWFAEAATFAAAYLGLWGSSTCLRVGHHLQVKLMWDYLPVKAGRVLSIILYIALLIFCMVLAKYGLEMAALSRGQMSESNTFNVYWMRLAVPTGGVLIGLQSLNIVLRELAGLMGASDWDEVVDEDEAIPET